jgi:predicted transcriptional regulator
MVNKLLLPQEVETYYIIPALRKQIAFALKNQGLLQKDVALILQIKSSAISQYNSSKRGSNIIFPNNIIHAISESSKSIIDSMSYLRETQKLLSLIRRSNFLCEVHKSLSEVPKGCTPDNMGCHLTAIGGCQTWN